MRRLARSLGKPDSLSSPGDDGDDPYDDGDDDDDDGGGGDDDGDDPYDDGDGELLIESRDQVSPQVGV